MENEYNYLFTSVVPVLFYLVGMKYILTIVSGYMAYKYNKTSLWVNFLLLLNYVLNGFFNTVYQLLVMGVLYAVYKREDCLTYLKTFDPKYYEKIAKVCGVITNLYNRYFPHSQFKIADNMLKNVYDKLMNFGFIKDIIGKIEASDNIANNEMEGFMNAFDRSLGSDRSLDVKMDCRKEQEQEKLEKELEQLMRSNNVDPKMKQFADQMQQLNALFGDFEKMIIKK